MCKIAEDDEFGERLALWDRAKGWNEIFSEHSDRSFTYKRDRLISLKGMATEMQKLRKNERYFFGLWTGDLPPQSPLEISPSLILPTKPRST